MKSNSVSRAASVTILLALLALVANLIPAMAHASGTIRLSSEPAGAYKVSVWTNPEPITTGEMHISAQISGLEDALPILDATVEVTLQPAGGGEPISAPATTENSENRFLYEAEFDLKQSGSYLATVYVSGDQGTGEASFEFIAEEGEGRSNLLVIAGVVGVGLAVWAALMVARRRWRTFPGTSA